MHCKATPIYGPACRIARHLMHATSQVIGLRCPLLRSTPSIVGSIINNVGIPSDRGFIALHTLYHPQLVVPWVEVSLSYVSSIRRY